MKTYEVMRVYEEEARLYKALGDPTRLQILGLLRVRELCVCELADLLPVTQPAVSQHLRRLREVGLVCERRQSYFTYYALSSSLPAQVAELIAALPPNPRQEAAVRETSSREACSAKVARETKGSLAPLAKQ